MSRCASPVKTYPGRKRKATGANHSSCGQGAELFPPGATAKTYKGHARAGFFVYPNFDVLLEWNKSELYIAALASLAAQLAGDPSFDPGAPDPMLNREDIEAAATKTD